MTWENILVTSDTYHGLQTNKGICQMHPGCRPVCGQERMKFARDIHCPQRKTRKKSAVWVPGRTKRERTLKVYEGPGAGWGTEPTITLLLTSDSAHFLI